MYGLKRLLMGLRYTITETFIQTHTHTNTHTSTHRRAKVVYGVQPQPVVAVHVAKARAVGRPLAVKCDVSTGPRLVGGGEDL